MTISNCAKIVQWNDEKGFGFAEANGARYFFHISALGLMSRRPKIGDTIIIENFGKSEKGLKIEKGSIKGVTVSSNNKRTTTYSKRSSSRRNTRSVMLVACLILAAIAGIGTQVSKGFAPSAASISIQKSDINPDGAYTTKMEVAKYICQYGHLPHNYVDKYTGKRMYEEKTGRYFSKWNFNPLTTIGVMIGGDNFSNREGLLPSGYWSEADVDYYASNRGTNRLVYGSGCNIYYTRDHYKSFSKIEF